VELADGQGKDILQRLDEIARALTDLGDILGREEDIGRVLQRGVGQVLHAIPAADMASVSVLRGDKAETVASTSDLVWVIDSDQYVAGEGPCLEAARDRKTVRVSLLDAEERWPLFARSARSAGVASYLSAPLAIDDKFVGSLNLYSRQVHGFGDLDEKLLQVYTAAAIAAIANARRYAEMRVVAENLRSALSSRAAIDQAIGALMVLRGFDAEQAFQTLSRESQNTNVKLRDVAGRVLETLPRGQDGQRPRR
jgi:GAF domain-containing protein